MRVLIAATFLWVMIGGVGASKNEVKTIKKDVAIIGGGGSGGYSAVRLREDYGVGVVVIEKEDMLGGHVNTWIDPATGRGFDAGVQSYIELPGALPFFHRLNVSTQPNARSTNQQVYVDFTTGEELNNYIPPSAGDRTDALRRYLALAEKYQPLLEPGWWTFPEPKDIPSDLLLPFDEFVAKYNLTAAVPQIFGVTGFGRHDIQNSQIMWAMRSFSVDMARTILGINPGFVPSSRRNQDLYDAILRLLGPDVLLSSTVVRTEARSDKDGVVLKVTNHVTGEITRVEAKKLLYAASPTEANIAPFDPDNQETAAFSNIKYGTSYVGVVSHPSLPRNTSLVNTPSDAQPTNYPGSIPVAPYNTRFDNYPNSSYYRIIVAGDASIGLEGAEKLVTDSFEKLVSGGLVVQTNPPQKLKIHLLASHGTVSSSATRESLEDGLIQKMNSLQGRRSTWWTGGTWSTPISTTLWIYTDTVLEKLVKSLSD